MHKITALRPVAIAAVLGVVSAVFIASYFWVPYLPLAIDVVRLEVIIVSLLGGPAALLAGRAGYRVALGAVLLIPAMWVQYLFGWIIGGEGPQCAAVLQDAAILYVFWRGFVLSKLVVEICIVIVAPLFAYFVLSRASPLHRLVAVAVLLLLIGTGTAAYALVLAGGPSHRCADF